MSDHPTHSEKHTAPDKKRSFPRDDVNRIARFRMKGITA